MGAKSSQTIGYHYLFSLYWGLCRGPINELVEIKAGDLSAWLGNACSDDVQYINKPDLFGGEKKEGGIQGPFALFQGAPDQVLPGEITVPNSAIGTDVPDNVGGILKIIFNGALIAGKILPSIKSLIGPKMSEMRGVVTLWFDGLIASMNPYPKEWKFRVRRSNAGWFNNEPWYPEKAAIYLTSDVLALAAIGPNIIITSDGGNGNVNFDALTTAGSTITINGVTITMIDGNTSEGLEAGIGSTRIESAANFFKVVNKNAAIIKAIATMTFLADNLSFSNQVGLRLSLEAQIVAMNGAHIVYECATNPEWGRGLPIEQIDDNALTYAANRMCDEGLGLCLVWYRKEDIDVFMQSVLDHIGGVTYTDRETGLFVLKLIRDDYDPATIPLYTPESGLLDIIEDDSASAETAYNEIIVTGHDPVTDEDIQARAHNIAAYQAQGAPSSLDLEYPGLPTLNLLARTAQRDLRVHAGGLKKFRVRLDRRAWRLTPGSVIRISDPRRSIENVILRVGEIDDGNLINGEIALAAVVDVFGLPATSYVTPVSSIWNPPPAYPQPATARAFELSYRDILRRAEAGTTIEDDESFLGTYARQPQNNSLTYNLLTKPSIALVYDAVTDSFSYTGNLIVTNALGPLDTEINIGASQELPEPSEIRSIVGQGLLIDDEIVRIDAFDHAAMTMTIARGCADTIPAPHTAGVLAWMTDDDAGSDGKSYSIGETVNAKVLPRTNQAVLLEESALALSLSMTGRAAKPYPPADVQIRRTYKFWRVRIDRVVDSNQVGLSALAFFDYAGVQLDGTYTASSTWSPYNVSDLKTFDYGSTWQSEPDDPFPQYVSIEFDDPQSPRTLRMQGTNIGFEERRSPIDYTIQASEDGVTWFDWQEYLDQPVFFADEIRQQDARGAGSSIYNLSGIYAEPMLTWASRNRVTQEDHLVGHVEGSVLGEVGQTYRVTVYAGEEQIGLYAGLTDLFFQYDTAKQIADEAGGTVRLVLQSERDGLLSTAYSTQIVVPITIGYGIGYGLNYGGVDV